MKKASRNRRRTSGPTFKRISLAGYFNWPKASPRGRWWKQLAQRVREYPSGRVTAWGIPFQAGKGRAILTAKGRGEVTIRLAGRADFLCLLHEWPQLPQDLLRNGKLGLTLSPENLRELQ